MLGKVEDLANELSNGDIYMINSKRDPSSHSPQNTTGNLNNPHRR